MLREQAADPFPIIGERSDLARVAREMFERGREDPLGLAIDRHPVPEHSEAVGAVALEPRKGAQGQHAARLLAQGANTVILD